jgi:hypothetical protein
MNPTYPTGSASANAIGYNTVNGLFYYFQNENSGSSQIFVSYNPTSNAYTTLANAPITAAVLKGCVSFNGTGYYCLDSNGNLCYYDITSNTWVLVCNSFTDQFGNNVTTSFQNMASGDMAIDALGNLWVVTSTGSVWGLYKIPTPLATSAISSMNVVQLVAPTTATPTGVNFVGIAFDPAGLIYMATNNDLYLLQSNFSLTHLAAFSIPGACGDLTSCNYPFTILPLSFENLNASSNGNHTVSVSWTIAQQRDAKGYNVERSNNGSDWNTVGFVAAQDNNATELNYQYTDANPGTGMIYYRIEAINEQGNESYSAVKTVEIADQSASAIALWPNPAKDIVNIQNKSEANATVSIYTQSGSLVRQMQLQPGTASVNISNLSFGAYIVHVSNADGSSFNQKFIKEF